MKLLTLIRKDKIKGPLRREFTMDNWHSLCIANTEDDVDRAIHRAGTLIYEKATQIRKLVRFAYSDAINSTTKIRALVAMSNLFSVDIQRRTRDKLADINPQTQFDLLTAKLDLPMGASFSPDEIQQGIVDGSQIPMREMLRGEINLNGQATFARVDWRAVWTDVNLGILYGHLESIWDDCLWNGYVPHEAGEHAPILFIPDDALWPKRLAASQLRRANNSLAFFVTAQNLVTRGEVPELAQFAATRSVKAVRRESRNQRISFYSVQDDPNSNVEAAIVRLYAGDTYYLTLLREPRQALCAATLDHLLNAWIMITQVSEVLRDPLLDSNSRDGPPHAWLPKYAPLLQKRALTSALTKELGVDLPQSTALIEFLTYRGKATQELWAQPLIPVSDESLTFSFGALSAEPSRLLDIWLRQLGEDLSLRGPAFEDHVREQLALMISNSPLQSISVVLPKAFEFVPADGRREEMDVVFRVGNVVIIGEIKCTLVPTEAKQKRVHRNVLVQAASQVQRKVESARKHSEEFRRQLRKQNLEIAGDFELLPIVVSNSAIHSGFPIAGVAVVDNLILDVFFSGSFSDTLMQAGEPSRDVRIYKIYDDSSQAPGALGPYLQAPPQMVTYLKGMRERMVPLGRLSPSDREWVCLEFESIPRNPHNSS